MVGLIVFHLADIDDFHVWQRFWQLGQVFFIRVRLVRANDLVRKRRALAHGRDEARRKPGGLHKGGHRFQIARKACVVLFHRRGQQITVAAQVCAI